MGKENEYIRRGKIKLFHGIRYSYCRLFDVIFHAVKEGTLIDNED